MTYYECVILKMDSDPNIQSIKHKTYYIKGDISTLMIT